MPRKPMVTRTIKTLEVKVTLFNLVTKEVKDMIAILPNKKYKDNEDILKTVSYRIDDTWKPITVLESRTHIKLYGMSEEQFLIVANELDENRKPINYQDTDSIV